MRVMLPRLEQTAISMGTPSKRMKMGRVGSTGNLTSATRAGLHRSRLSALLTSWDYPSLGTSESDCEPRDPPSIG